MGIGVKIGKQINKIKSIEIDLHICDQLGFFDKHVNAEAI